MGQISLCVKYEQKGGGDALQLRLGVNAGLAAAVDRLKDIEDMEEGEDDDTALDLISTESQNDPDKEGGTMFRNFFGAKKKEGKKKATIDDDGVHKKIVDTNARLARDREFATFEEYRYQNICWKSPTS